MFTKILLIVLISAMIVQAQNAGEKIHLSPEQKKAFISIALSGLQQKFNNRAKRSPDIVSDAYNDLMNAVEERIEERLEEGVDLTCAPFFGGF